MLDMFKGGLKNLREYIAGFSIISSTLPGCSKLFLALFLVLTMFGAHSVAVIGWQRNFYCLLWDNYASQIIGQTWSECELSPSGSPGSCLLCDHDRDGVSRTPLSTPNLETLILHNCGISLLQHFIAPSLRHLKISKERRLRCNSNLCLVLPSGR